jgi:hypothetical protein
MMISGLRQLALLPATGLDVHHLIDGLHLQPDAAGLLPRIGTDFVIRYCTALCDEGPLTVERDFYRSVLYVVYFPRHCRNDKYTAGGGAFSYKRL